MMRCVLAALATILLIAALGLITSEAQQREGAFFGPTVINLPSGAIPGARGIDFMLTHRFNEDIRKAGPSQLFGLDGGSSVSYAARFGLTDRISFAVRRNAKHEPNKDNTIEISSSLQVLRQKQNAVTLQINGGLGGTHNFGRHYSPFVQCVAVHTVKDRLSLLVAPTFAFNTTVNKTVAAETANHTIALGIGAGIRMNKSTSVVGEYIPRLRGYKGAGAVHQAGMSFGLQHATFRHVFELVITKQTPTTVAQYAVGGGGLFRIGFNLYRKIK